MILNVTINDLERQFQINSDDMLLDVLRKNGYVSVKKGCDTSSCGICTILIDDKPISSCSYLAIRAENKHITTMEGAKREGEIIASFLTSEGAEQCGYCSPSFALSIIAMKKEFKGKKVSDDDIRHYLVGNLCRCSGYQGHLRAIKKYLAYEGE